MSRSSQLFDRACQIRHLLRQRIAAASALFGVNGRTTTPTWQTMEILEPRLLLNADTILWGAQPETKQILKLNPQTGEILDQFPVPLQDMSTSVGLTIAAGGKMLLYTDGFVEPEGLYGLDPNDGSLVSEHFIPTAYDASGLSFEFLRPALSSVEFSS